MLGKPQVSVAIMAHRKREEFVPALLDKLDRPAKVVWDSGNDDRWDTGRRAMLAYDESATHHLVVQDDAIVCRDLVAGLESALENVPAGVPLVLYAGRLRPFRLHVQRLVERATHDTSWLTMSAMLWGVAIVIPTRLIDAVIMHGDKRPDIANYDARLSLYFEERGIPVWYPWPSMVDHRQSPSLVPGRGMTGRYAHRFIGEDVSALETSYRGRAVSIPELSRRL